MANQKTSQYPLADLGILFTNGGLLDFSQAVSISISPPSITYDSRGLEILDFISLIENNIYHNDGVIPENRTVDVDGNMLSFINGAEYSFTGDVFRYTSNLFAELRVDDTGALIGKNTSQYLSIDDTGARLIHNTNINLDCVDVIFDQLTAGTVPYLDSNIALKSSIVTLLELNNLSGSTSNIQAQINALASGVSSWKDPVVIAVDTNVTLSGEQTIQGETTSNSRVLLWQQTDPTENGIWVTDSGSWTRATDFDANTDKIAGSVTVILAGDYAEHRFICSNNDPVVVGTDAISFIDLPGEYVGTTNRITISGNIIDISTSYAGQTSITTLGTISTGTWNGTSIADAYISSASNWNAYATTKERKSTEYNVSGTVIDWSLATHFYKTLSANTTFTFSNDAAADTIIIKLTQGASAYTVTWPSGVKWADGIEPVMSTSNGAVDVYTLTKIGSEILGSYVQNMS